METTDTLNPIITIDEAASSLGLHVQSVYRLAQRGKLPGARKFGGRWLINRSVFEKSGRDVLEQPTRREILAKARKCKEEKMNAFKNASFTDVYSNGEPAVLVTEIVALTGQGQSVITLAWRRHIEVPVRRTDAGRLCLTATGVKLLLRIIKNRAWQPKNARDMRAALQAAGAFCKARQARPAPGVPQVAPHVPGRPRAAQGGPGEGAKRPLTMAEIQALWESTAPTAPPPRPPNAQAKGDPFGNLWATAVMKALSPDAIREVVRSTVAEAVEEVLASRRVLTDGDILLIRGVVRQEMTSVTKHRATAAVGAVDALNARRTSDHETTADTTVVVDSKNGVLHRVTRMNASPGEGVE